MAEKVDIDFTFATEPFMKAMEKVNGGLNSLIKKAAVLAGSFIAVRSVAKSIPEVGQAFSIAGDVMKRNFLEPLRQWLVPMLMEMMNWVRKNRTMFVQAGVVFLNVIKALWTILKQVIGLLKTMFDAFVESVGGGMKDLVNNTSQTINMLLFKLATVFIFVGELLKPVFKLVGKIFGFLFKAVSAFFTGFMKGIGPILNAFSELWKVVAGFFEEIVGGGETTKVLLKIFEGMGEILSKVILVALQSIRHILNVVIQFVKGVAVGIWNAIGGSEGFEKIKSDLLSVFDTVGNVVKSVAKAIAPVTEFIGRLIGGALGSALNIALGIVKLIADVVQGILDGIKWLAGAVNTIANALGVNTKSKTRFSRFGPEANKDNSVQPVINMIVQSKKHQDEKMLPYVKQLFDKVWTKDQNSMYEHMYKRNPRLMERAKNEGYLKDQPGLSKKYGGMAFLEDKTTGGTRVASITIGDINITGGGSPVETAGILKRDLPGIILGMLNKDQQLVGA